ncbi:MAG: hypothetical protein H8E14_09920 [Candidatus Marinimicrobia bacterium]|nr:hypothetical protein [Candidatus Neomarinimicrobiota bacterium]
MKKIILLSLFVLSLFISAQEVQPNITEEKIRLLILPSTAGERYEEIATQVTGIVASEATRLGRFVIIDRSQLEAIMNEQALQLSGIINDSDVVEIGKITAAKEALLINVYNFNQKGVPPDDDDDDDDDDGKGFGLIGEIAKSIVDATIDKVMEDVERYPNNIQTVINGDVRKLNLETGQSLSSFSINISHTGGNKGKSMNKALNSLALQVSLELREMYLLTSQVLDVRGREVILLLGRNLGINKGTRFAISSPSTKRQVGDYEIDIPGRRVGFVKVTELSQNANRGLILRNWEPIEPGFIAVESTGRIMAGSLSLKYGSGSSDMGLDLTGYFNPLGQTGGSVFFGLGTIKDSYDEIDFSLRFGIDLYFRLINTIPFSLAGSVSLPIQFPIRDDDEGNKVSAVLFSPVIGGRAEIMLSSNMDLIATLGYCPSSQLSKWDYSEDDDDKSNSIPAEWDDGVGPKFDSSGLYFNIGFRFLIFDSGIKAPSLSEMSRFW